MKKPVLLLVFIVLMTCVWASDRPSFTFSAEAKANTPAVDIARKAFYVKKLSYENLNCSYGLSAEADYKFFNLQIAARGGEISLVRLESIRLWLMA